MPRPRSIVPLAAVKSLSLYPEPPNTRIRGTGDSSPRPMYTCEPEDPNALRPCPWSGCRYVLPGGSCSVDHVEEHGAGSAAQVATELGITRNHVMILQRRALAKLRAFGFNFRLVKEGA